MMMTFGAPHTVQQGLVMVSYGCRLDLQDGGKAAQKLMQPSPQSVDALKKIMDDARHKAGGAPPQHKEHFNEEDYMDGELNMDDDAHVHD